MKPIQGDAVSQWDIKLSNVVIRVANMAKCDQGYLCQVCGEEVEDIIDSDLYLRYVIGWVDPETLHTTRECHIRCNPTLAQFIVDERLQPPVVLEGDWSKLSMDPEFVRERTELVARGYARLWELFNDETRPPVIEYPIQPFLANSNRSTS